MKRSPVIEMTALLDVILILMFLVLAGASQKVEDIKKDIASSEVLEQRISGLINQNDSLTRRLNSFTVLKRSCLVITLSISRAEDGARSVLLECEGDQSQTIGLTWFNLQYVKNTLRAQIVKMIEGALPQYQAVFIVFQYDRNLIYQTDYRLISNVIQAQKTRADVYCAEYDIREEQDE